MKSKLCGGKNQFFYEKIKFEEKGNILTQSVHFDIKSQNPEIKGQNIRDIKVKFSREKKSKSWDKTKFWG